MTQITIGIVVFIIAMAVLIIGAKTFPPTIRLVVAVLMVEAVCVAGLLIAMGLYNIGLMD